jgi:hypothetical protein
MRAAAKTTGARWLCALTAVALLITLVADVDARRRRRRRRRAARAPAKGLVLATALRGRNGARLRRGLAAGLRRGGLKLVSWKRYRDKADGKVDPKDAASLQALCAKIERCKAVLVISTERKRRRYRVSVEALAPNTTQGAGAAIGSQSATARSARRLTRTAATLARKLAKPIVAYEPPPPPPPPKPDPTPPPAPKPDPKPVVTAPPPAPPSVARRNDPSEAFVIADVGFGLSTRDLELIGLGGQPDIRRHQGGAFGEITLRAEVYPAALLTRSIAQHIGLVGTFSHHLVMQTRAEGPATLGGVEADIDGSSMQLHGGLRFRLPIGPRSLGPALVFAEAGLGLRSFGLGDNAAPEMNYRFLRFALGGEIALLDGLLRLGLSADIRPFLGIGQETANALGSRDGGLAFAIAGRVGGQLAFGLRYFVGVEYSHYSVSFAGLGGTSRPPLPGTLERDAPSDATDSYLRVLTGVGYAY